MNQKSSEVLHFQAVHVSEMGSSVLMEKQGLIKVLDKLKSSKLEVTCLTITFHTNLTFGIYQKVLKNCKCCKEKIMS